MNDDREVEIVLTAVRTLFENTSEAVAPNPLQKSDTKYTANDHSPRVLYTSLKKGVNVTRSVLNVLRAFFTAVPGSRNLSDCSVSHTTRHTPSLSSRSDG